MENFKKTKRKEEEEIEKLLKSYTISALENLLERETRKFERGVFFSDGERDKKERFISMIKKELKSKETEEIRKEIKKCDTPNLKQKLEKLEEKDKLLLYPEEKRFIKEAKKELERRKEEEELENKKKEKLEKIRKEIKGYDTPTLKQKFEKSKKENESSLLFLFLKEAKEELEKREEEKRKAIERREEEKRKAIERREEEKRKEIERREEEKRKKTEESLKSYNIVDLEGLLGRERQAFCEGFFSSKEEQDEKSIFILMIRKELRKRKTEKNSIISM